MLLQRLVEHADTSTDVVPAFYARKPVRWMLDIGSDGAPRGDLVDTADKDDPNRRFGAPRLVPAVTRTVAISPTLAVDNGEYVFGWLAEDAKPTRVAKQHEAFRALISDWAAAELAGPAGAIDAFYRSGHAAAIACPAEWSRGDLIGFSVYGAYAADTPEARRFWAGVAGDRKGSGRMGLCLVCGQVQPLLKTVPQQIPRRWVPGATQNASLVSMNEAVHGYELQKFLTNTPICTDCGLKFMTALTGLLSDPKHSTALPGQNARLAWWVVGGSTFDPWAMVEQLDPTHIQALVASPAAGLQAAVEDASKYCSVTVGGNVARVVVRDWVEQPVHQVKDNVRAWFDDHRIVDAWTGEVVQIRVSQLARAAGRFEAGRNGGPGTWTKFGKSGEHRPPDLFHRLLGAALLKRPLPPKLLNHVINRIRIDGRLDPARAALIRLALRRHPTLAQHDRERLTPTLNVENPTRAYVSGRIFAVMDDLQRTVSRVAEQKLNTTFAERYFGRAIDNPQVVIVAGRRNVQAWLKRLRGPLRRPTWSQAYERRLDDLFAQLDAIPSQAVLTDKAYFILGYHQQRADMRTERIAASANKKNTDLPPEPADEASTTNPEGDDA
ncbi:type I-C CRISPR-associated protein Cas8c/Csd1 [Micromonospora chalcea]|uniref:type I-C CRISPR-associated protein Cas8c/Csd1 n=1 Tax=Micromonospora chalcea TaxID=1874 RepID=UPI001656BD0C|nr:type I-C CRISPR-associated protein Cas8c/Csd1 [Micromonospora chalcea]MBC8989121.1 type I-C CRISPR-associated protein Cas8c/Csd1 [Micromonospora chalcea]